MSDHTPTGTRGRPRRRSRAVVVTAWGSLLGYGVVLLALASCISTPPPTESVEAAKRLELIPTRGLETHAPVEILWDDHLIPTIIAEDERDVPYTMGLVHAHLRLAQMELIKRVARGRLSESAGPLANRIDHAIRAIDLDRAVPEIASSLPPETRAWLDRYVEGVNEYRARVRARPADFEAMGFEDEPWTIEDSLAIGRLASVDLTWGRWLAFYPLREEKGFEDFMARLNGFADAGRPSFGPSTPTPLDALLKFGKTGSNAFVVSGDRTASGSAIVACDPHLGITQPNIWCIMGYRTSGRAITGLTIPGMPFVLVGRNQHVAWGGTNMQNVASILYDVEDEDESTFETRTERLDTRWWFDTSVSIRESEHGPVISDASLFRELSEGPVAMRWIGHDPSDEATAFLEAARARNWEEFRDAFATFAAGGHNMLYGDRAGNIGQVLATRWVPAATRAGLSGPVDPNDPRFGWSEGLTGGDLPVAINPESGYIASANNVPVRTDPPLLVQGNANDRMERMERVLAEKENLTLDDALGLQLDTYSGQSLEAAKTIVAALADATDPSTEAIVAALRDWDGYYDADSPGAAAYVLITHHLLDEAYTDRYSKKIIRRIRSGAYVHAFIAEDMRTGAIDAKTMASAARAAAREFADETVWGDLHRTRLAHPLGMVPVLGEAYRFGEFPAPGSTTTIYKSAHSITNEEHHTSFGANARFVADMADPDATYVVLLGGQDGWLGSDRLLDQVELWRRGEAIPLPLREASQRARARWRTMIEPRGVTPAEEIAPVEGDL